MEKTLESFLESRTCKVTLNEDIKENLEAVQDLLNIQLMDGNWNCDPYMHGMANGMILCMSILRGEVPKFLDAPEEWIFDRND